MNSLLIALGFAVCLALIALMAIRLCCARRKKSEQLQGVELLQSLQKLVVLTQKHRGLSSGYLKGDKALLASINQLRSDINTARQALTQAVQLNYNERWTLFLNDWNALLADYSQLTSPDSFRRHCCLISNLLNLIEDQAIGHQLVREAIVEHPEINVLYRELLLVSEYVGQSRALGTGVAAAKRCSSVEKIRMQFLLTQIESIAGDVLNRLARGYQHRSGPLRSLTSTAESKCQQLTDSIKRELLSEDKVTLEAIEYYNLATESIDAFVAIFDHQMLGVEQSLRQH
ncbi:nitrate- and nitrite sensing domain-containing protein [Aestuariirhabdus sp. Z084]|uniref:nitrate- and nitrite sensing domain-containing protein n=1 Tax=Aestuariirhabdus haliotis TaxID=2918751 RepID=UPI00201B36A5|nr:nitrate- and nitrite sensing domain-containing protein [Aestuariirhabdus haliotis]MCL6417379.1 nitrate- and nitrite sensing domain-containing protein [Aestuariirhabdus haliotis]MCL6421324.1 nitrate- and nitrite sensing domain-containing protein [Aestuariirhabdus haliotis]